MSRNRSKIKGFSAGYKREGAGWEGGKEEGSGGGGWGHGEG